MKTLTKKDLVLLDRNKDAHKGQAGRVLIIGGSQEYAGALALAGLAALRSGCDLVTIAAPEKVAWAVNALCADLITIKLPGKYLRSRHRSTLLKLWESHDVVLIGNGAGTKRSTLRLLRSLARLKGKKVIDADAFKAIAASDVSEAILTPHAAELETFLHNSGVPHGLAPTALQKRLEEFFSRGNVLLLKGEEDIVISQEQIAKNTTGNPGMAKAGTGDVLAGLCAGYYAQLGDAWQAACNAAYINGQIGDLLLKKHKGYTYLASDLVEEMKKRG